MDSARQLMRWGIPGWVYLLLVSFNLAFVRFLVDPAFSVGEILGAGGSNSTYGSPQVVASMLVALAIGSGTAGIPIGIIAYQFYYYVYWMGPHIGLWPRTDAGFEILQDVVKSYEDNGEVIPAYDFIRHTNKFPNKVPTLGDMSYADEFTGTAKVAISQIRLLGMRSAWQVHWKNSHNVEDRVRDNWYLAFFTLNRISIDCELPSSVVAYVSYLTDLFHTFGTLRLIVLSAWSSVFLYKAYGFLSHRSEIVVITVGVGLAIELVIAILVFVLFTNARRNSMRSLVEFCHHIITSYHRSPPQKLLQTRGRTPTNGKKNTALTKVEKPAHEPKPN